MTQIDTQTRFARFNSFIAQGLIIRNKWHDTDAQGRETACLLGAFGKDIDDSSKCPAEIMPAWLARLTVSFDDNGSLDKWPAMIKRYGAVANRWHVLDAAAWDICLAKTLKAALLIAELYDKKNVVRPVIALLDRQIAGDRPTREEWQKARAAAAAAAAVYAAAAAAAAADAYAAYAAAAVYADAAVYAAAADAAAAAAAADAYADSTQQTSWDKITDACLTAIEDECAKAESP